MRYSRALTAVAAATTLAAGGLAAVQSAAVPPAHAAPVPPGAPGAERALLAAADEPPTIHKDRTGVIRSVAAKPGHALRRPAGVPANPSPETAARGFLKSYGAAFGLPDPGAALKMVRADRTREGDRVVRFQQQVAGVPVLAGNVVVSTRENGEVLGATSEVATRAITPVAPRISKERAVATAVQTAARKHKVAGNRLLAEASRWLYDPALIGAPGRAGLRPVWQVEVSSPTDAGIEDLLLVDATVGNVELALDHSHTAQHRIICDFANRRVAESGATCDTGNATRSEGQPASAIVDVNKAYDYTNSTYYFYFNQFGRDSLDDKGMTLRSSVRVCLLEDPQCPYRNAFWSGQMQQMVYGAGFANADDVVGHEFTHGFTEYTSNLFYAYQSGAINESMSDVFGEYIDQKAPWPGTRDGASWNWQLGEDLSVGAIRNMANPPLYGDPDKMTSTLYFGRQDANGDGWADDNGGVHYNSGIGNKAAYLLTEPGTRTFNGVSVTGIGLEKAAQVYYRTQLLLTSGADYADLAATLQGACAQLATAGTKGITAADCTQVRNATNAVEMTKQPTSPTAQAPEAPVCPTGGTPQELFADDMENPASGKWTLAPPNWIYLDPAQTGGIGYAHSGKVAILGDLFTGTGTAAATAAPIAVPTWKKTYFWFAHVKDFLISQNKFYSGGRVEYRSDGGAWTDAGALFTHNGYNGRLEPDPGPAVSALVGDSHGYVSSRLDLTSLGGHNVELRFVTLGRPDGSWVIDDAKVYTCGADKPGPVVGLTGTGGLNSVTLKWSAPVIHGPAPVTGYRVTVDATLADFPKTVPVEGPLALQVTGLAARWYTFTVTPMAGEAAGTPTKLLVKSSSLAVTASPTTVLNTKPTTIAGTVNLLGGGVATNGTATVFGRAKGVTTWSRLGAVAVSSTGRFSYVHVPPKNFEYMVQYTGGTAVQGSRSAVITVLLSPTVTVVASPTTVNRGGTVRFSGQTYPARVSTQVILQFFYNNVWNNVLVGATASNGSYVLNARLFRPGTYYYRIVVPGNTQYTTGISALVRITTL